VTICDQHRATQREPRGHPTRALGDGAGERAAVFMIGITMLALAVIGMYVSFQTVYEYVHPWFRDTAWAVPIAIDVAILVFSAADLLLSYWRMAKPSMRLIPWGFTAATIWLNWQAGGPVPIRIAHAAMPGLWVLFCEYARHVLAARVGLVGGMRMEKVRRSRWLLAPLSTARLRRRMILWEITSYRRALELEAERRAEIARLEMAHGRKWRRHAPAHERLAVKLAAVAPAELLPSLAATLAPPKPETGTEPPPAPAGHVEPARADDAPTVETRAVRAGDVPTVELRAVVDTPTVETRPRAGDLVEPKTLPDAGADPRHARAEPAPTRTAKPAQSQTTEPAQSQTAGGGTRRPDPGAGHAEPAPVQAAEGSARQRAVALLAAEPDLPGTELARRLGVTTGYGRRLRSELLNATNGYR
jgi:hypothetical protein